MQSSKIGMCILFPNIERYLQAKKAQGFEPRILQIKSVNNFTKILAWRDLTHEIVIFMTTANCIVRGTLIVIDCSTVIDRFPVTGQMTERTISSS